MGLFSSGTVKEPGNQSNNTARRGVTRLNGTEVTKVNGKVVETKRWDPVQKKYV